MLSIKNLKGLSSSLTHRISSNFFLIYFVLLLGCQSGTTEETDEKYYYDLKGFIEKQIIYLEDKKPKVEKMALLNGREEAVKTEAIDWRKELELFLQADINKPSYRQSYQVTRRDSTEYEYTLKPNTKLPVQYLKIITDTSVNQPIYVKALLLSENKIYKSEKNIELFCSRRDNLWELSSFSVKGYQKLMFIDKKSFQITSKIGL
jgi:hypothetical protein